MENMAQLVVFSLDKSRIALPLSSVDRVVHAVDVTHLPKAPDIVLGVINLQGAVIPVVNARKRFRLQERGIGLKDQLIILHSSKRPIAILADSVECVVECPERRVVEAEKVLPGMEYVRGIVKLDDGMILIHDIDGFLSIEEEDALDSAIRGAEG